MATAARLSEQSGCPFAGRTMALRRRPVRIVDGQPEVGYASMYGIISCHRGDRPGPDHREVRQWPRAQLHEREE
jgi:hypothetical protein